MTSDLFEAAQLACRSYWDGSDKSKINMREAMSDLRVCVEIEKSKRAKQETAKIVKEAK